MTILARIASALPSRLWISDAKADLIDSSTLELKTTWNT